MAKPPRRNVVISIVVVTLVLVALPLLWGTTMIPMIGPWMMGGWNIGVSPWWGLLSLFLGLLVLGGAALIVAWMLGCGGSNPTQGDDRALAILRERFARGELTQDEYERMRQVLTECE